MQKSIYERLNISKERGEFLHQKCNEIYKEFSCKTGDAIDVIEKAREITTNASEDIYVCFIIGTFQGKFIAMQQTFKNELASTLKNIFER